MIEKNLERIADALEKIAGQGGTITSAPIAAVLAETLPTAPKAANKRAAKKPAAAAPTSTPSVESQSADSHVVTKDYVMDKLREYVKDNGQEKAKAILAEHGAGRVSELPEGKFAAVLEALTA